MNVGVFADSEQRAAPLWAVSPCHLNRVSWVRVFLCIDLVGKRWKRCRTWLGCYRNTCGQAVVGGQSKQRRPQEKNYFGWRGSRYFLFIGNHLTKQGHIAIDMSVLRLSRCSENKIWRHPDWHGQCALIDLIFTARRRVCKALVRFAKRTPLQRAVAYHLAAYLPVGPAPSAHWNLWLCFRFWRFPRNLVFMFV